MSFKDLEIKNSYDSTIDDVLDEFYQPVLSNSIIYDRIAGFFTSSSLAISAKGLLNIAENGGKVRLLISPKLNKEDIEIITDAQMHPEEHINHVLYNELLKKESEIIENYKELLAHLIAKEIVEIKLVLVKNDNGYLTEEEINRSALFHQKVGIMTDCEGNVITFSGSINESFTAWNDNVEEFKTFKSWELGQNSYCEEDIKKFNDFWTGQRNKVKVMNLPDAIKNKFIEISEEHDYEFVKKKIKARYRKKEIDRIYDSLFWYQKEAVKAWNNNDKKLLFAMATGTGKTRTALACLNQILNNEKIVAIIATPQSALSRQWYKEFVDLGLNSDKLLICDSSSKYKSELSNSISRINLDIISNMVLFTTHATSSSSTFINEISRINDKIKILFIGDEVHGLGSKKQRDALQIKYDYRIGLSATPSRWFDDEGSDYLQAYFGNEMFEFSIEDAIHEINPLTNKTFLTPYYYYPESVYLTKSEEIEYEILTDKIAKCLGDDEDTIDIRNNLLQKRAEIVKNAEDKLVVLEKLLKKIMSKGRIDNTIIFTSPKHIKKVLILLSKYGIIASPLTEKEKNTISPKFGGRSERQMIIDEFKSKHIQVIVAIKCMDEGIDIPSADTAILMSSTTNPREYIQRIGRVIRRYKGKDYANIYDLVVKSHDPIINEKLQKNELKRIKYIVSLATNAISTLLEIFN